MTVNWLQILLSPHFLTLRHRRPPAKLNQPQFRECLAAGEFVGLTTSLDAARAIVPRPSYPESPEKIAEFHERYGWEHEPLSDGGQVDKVPSVRFDDHPQSDGRERDHHLFGVSFVVLWLCPYDLVRIGGNLLQHVTQLLLHPERSPSFLRFRSERSLHRPTYESPKQLHQHVAKYAKRELIDRLCLLEPVEEQIVSTIKLELQQCLDF
jgi:hypothetical protein